MASKRRKILLVAYACRPGESSEREVGWKWATLIQKRHDVTVLTRASHKPHIEAWRAAHPGHGALPEFIFYDLPSWAMMFKKGERGLYLYYVFWSLFAILKARRINRDHRFEITHFLTFGTLIWPQFGFLMNTRYVLGPVGGGERVPLSLRRAFGPVGQIKIFARRLVQASLRLNPVYWANLHRADHILARTRETLAMLPAPMRAKSSLLLETGVPEGIETPDAKAAPEAPLAIIAVGRLITTKFNPLLLEALKAFKDAWGKPFRFTIIGDGPERARLEALRDALGLHEVEFLGKLPGPAVLKALHQSDIYFSTTMKEGGTWAFFEAISCRVPIVCLKVNGPDMIVGDGCGIKVPPGRYTPTKNALAAGLLGLAENPAAREAYAEKALAYIEQTYGWHHMQDRIDAVYQQVMAKKGAGA